MIDVFFPLVVLPRWKEVHQMQMTVMSTCQEIFGQLKMIDQAFSVDIPTNNKHRRASQDLYSLEKGRLTIIEP